MSAMRRQMMWLKGQNFQGWACSECAWVFKPLGPPVDESIEAMKTHYQEQRDKEFSSHVCADHPRAKKGPL
jgi:rubredoxin